MSETVTYKKKKKQDQKLPEGKGLDFTYTLKKFDLTMTSSKWKSWCCKRKFHKSISVFRKGKQNQAAE